MKNFDFLVIVKNIDSIVPSIDWCIDNIGPVISVYEGVFQGEEWANGDRLFVFKTKEVASFFSLTWGE